MFGAIRCFFRKHAWTPSPWKSISPTTCQATQTCTRCQLQEPIGPNKPHIWGGPKRDQPGSCLYTVECLRCGTTEPRQSKHTWTAWVRSPENPCLAVMTCTRCHLTNDRRLEHRMVPPETGNGPLVCKRCGHKGPTMPAPNKTFSREDWPTDNDDVSDWWREQP